jgi:hypothetical protein
MELAAVIPVSTYAVLDGAANGARCADTSGGLEQRGRAGASPFDAGWCAE